jgi:hypothetical protein
MTQPTDIPPWKQLRDLKPSPTEDVEPWNPWQTLAENYPDWLLVTDRDLGERTWGLTFRESKRIYLCKTLGKYEKTATLAHELVHVELGIWNGHGAHRSADYSEQERVVVEVTARRLIPFRHLAQVITQRPEALFRVWAHLLHVDRITLSERLITLTPNERAALTQVRGGPLPTTPYLELFDGKEVA